MTNYQETSDRTDWQADFERRTVTAYQEAGCAPALARALHDRAAERLPDSTLLTDGTHWLALSVTDGVGRVRDLTDPAALPFAERWCAERGATRVESRLVGDPGPFADYPIVGQNRMRTFATAEPPQPPPGLTVRPLTEAEYPAWLADEQASYVFDILRAGALTPEEAQQKSDQDFAQELPQGQHTPGHGFYAFEAGGEVVGTGWVQHAFLPGTTFGFSLEIHEQHRGKGHGRAAMAAGEWITRQGGDDTLMFNVFGGNEVAMNLYDATGFTVIDEIRSRPLD
ncbi:GNAT family N-acetyltransferase [Kitasatospora sp. NPDC051853]|uniref:GNAT family N-acetyltransferase n=1 Tax=Kitasatospora sp. NPDC051853 TaxID=3364058 RepID=UPI0037B4F07D